MQGQNACRRILHHKDDALLKHTLLTITNRPQLVVATVEDLDRARGGWNITLTITELEWYSSMLGRLVLNSAGV